MIILLFYYLLTNPVFAYSSSIWSICGAICMALNVFTYNICIHTFSNVYQLATFFQCASALISFVRLKQSDRLLSEILSKLTNILKLNHLKSRQSMLVSYLRSSFVMSLNRFYRFHLECRRSVFSQNKIFGNQLFETILLYTPANAFMIWSLIFGRVELVNAIVFAIMVCCQVAYIFGIHLIAVEYPKRIHRPGKLLNQIYMKHGTWKESQFRQHLALSQAIQMLHVHNQYGITYGPAHLVTMATFGKVRYRFPAKNKVFKYFFPQFLMFYYKFMTFSYKINKESS